LVLYGIEWDFQDANCDICKSILKNIPDLSIESNVTFSSQAGVKLGEMFEADITVGNIGLMKDELSFKNGKLSDVIRLRPLVLDEEGNIQNTGKMTVENSIGVKGFGFGGKVGQTQDIDGDLGSSNGVQFVERGAEAGGFGAKIIEEIKPNGNSVVKSEESFSVGAKFIIGVEFKFKVLRNNED
jgi:hypothetical protein